jgi:aspartate/methionine/tyrosine aminotransferase
LIPSPISTLAAAIRAYDGERPLIDLSQGVPNMPPAPTIVKRLTEAVNEPDSGGYAARGGLPELRRMMAEELSRAYHGVVAPEQVLITAGCNQAFCAATSALASPGEEVILPVPYYFNHDMWLRMDGITPVHLEMAAPFVPSVAMAERLITPLTRAIVLVTPGNPTGATIPPEVVGGFFDLVRRRDLVLIIDECYRSFRPTEASAHAMFARKDWADHVVSLHSFSKEFALPGYRVGAAVGHPDLVTEMAKLVDCMAICAPRIGQEAAIAALSSALDWRSGYAQELREKLTYFERMMSGRPGGFELSSAGAFFGWIRHPFEGEPTEEVARRLLMDLGVAVLPGTIFEPRDSRHIRVSYGSGSRRDIYEFGLRLRGIR